MEGASGNIQYVDGGQPSPQARKSPQQRHGEQRHVELGGDASAEEYRVRELLSVGAGRALTNPVTAVAAHVDACLRMLDSSQTPHLTESQLSKLKSHLQAASNDAGHAVELLQRWKSLQRIQRGKRSIGRPALILQDCINAMQPSFSKGQHSLKVTLRSQRAAYFDQFSCFELYREILERCILRASEYRSGTCVECHDNDQAIAIRVRTLPYEHDELTCEQHTTAMSDVSAALSRLFPVRDLGRWSKAVADMGGTVCWLTLSGSEFDFGFSFTPHISKGRG